MWGMLLWYLRSNTEKQKICLVQVVSENITWNCSCSPQVQVWAWRVQGCWIYAFVTLVPASWTCDFVTLVPDLGRTGTTSLDVFCTNQFFTNLHYFFFYEHLGRFCINFCIPLLFVQNAIVKKKNPRNWKGKAGALETYPTFFSPSLFFLYTLRRFSIIFFSIPLVFVQG